MEVTTGMLLAHDQRDWRCLRATAKALPASDMPVWVDWSEVIAFEVKQRFDYEVEIEVLLRTSSTRVSGWIFEQLIQ